MRGLRAALGFMTILPVGDGDRWRAGFTVAWLPVVGLILGGLWAAFDAVAGVLFPLPLRAGLDVLFMVVVTGGLHLDGLADTADGILSHRGPEEALRIMKDSRIGTWGVLAVVAVLGLKFQALSEGPLGQRALTLALVPAYGRLAMALGVELLPYGRGTEGMAHGLFSGKGWRQCTIPVLLVGGSSTLLGWRDALLVNAFFVLATACVLCFYHRRMRCITGDMLGALGEVTECALLVALAGRWI
ncbi:MAG: adenosylcobinamide-GDP ribazoletransferase [Thermodesulfobacteriota bacterium]